MADQREQIYDEPADGEIPVEQAEEEIPTGPNGNEGRTTAYPPMEETSFVLDEPLVPFVEKIIPMVPSETVLLFTFPEGGGFQVHEKSVSIDQICAAKSWLEARILRYFSMEQALDERRRAVAKQGQQNAGG